MRIGGLGLLGLGLPSLLGTSQLGTSPLGSAFFGGSAAAAETAGARVIPSGGKAKSCILLFLMGGPPQHSTFDPKPDAPAEVRGEFGPVATNVPGIQFADCLPRLSKVADKLCVLRAVSTGDNAHSSSGYYMLTGRPHAPMNRENANPGAPNDWPCLAAIVQSLAAPRGELPSGIRLPKHIFNTDGSVWPGQDAGFLGRNADPWLFRCEPASPNFQIPEFQLPVDVPAERLNGRHSLLRDFNQHLNQVEQRGALDHYDGLTRRAFGLLSSNESRAALDLSREPEALRQRYGMTQFGQSTLLARRLIDAGVRLVQVNWFRGPDEPTDAPCWDSHTNEAARLRNVLAA
ncbi:MAG TPA: DUF1501 domain-containing protein, partial [Pirellulaceae bacterium]|nr:DUF1501 domain-containing protein [Pirellulaceae bacterium]